MKVGQRFLHLFLDSVDVILTSVQDMRRAEVSSVIPCEEQLVGNAYWWVSCSVVYFHFGEMRYCWWSFWSVEWVWVSPSRKGLLVAGWVLQERQTIGVGRARVWVGTVAWSHFCFLSSIWLFRTSETVISVVSIGHFHIRA